MDKIVFTYYQRNIVKANNTVQNESLSLPEF